MRSGLQGAGAVGAAPGLAMLVPWPPRSTTRVPAAETATLPRSTNTPKTPALGPAKKRVPRTAIRPKGVRICIRAGGVPAGRSYRIGPERSVISPPAFTRKRSMVTRACCPTRNVVSLPRCNVRRESNPVPTRSLMNKGAARSSVRRSARASANASPLTSSTEPTGLAPCADAGCGSGEAGGGRSSRHRGFSQSAFSLEPPFRSHSRSPVRWL
jgi:hypothetical protein